MKVSFFLLKFPLASETFVLNQIVAFIEMGHEVEIVALQKGDLTNTHAAYTQYRLAEKFAGCRMSRRPRWRSCAIAGSAPCVACIALRFGGRSICSATATRLAI